MKEQEQVIEEVKMVRYICVRTKQIGDRSYAPGQFLEAPEGVRVPDEFMRCEFEGVGSTGPWYFCTKECYRNGRLYSIGQLWDVPTFKQKPPEKLFALLSDKESYAKVRVSNYWEYHLKPRPVESA